MIRIRCLAAAILFIYLFFIIIMLMLLLIVLRIKGHEADNVTTEVARGNIGRRKEEYKIPKGRNQNKSVKRRAHNTMAKRKRKQFRIRL